MYIHLSTDRIQLSKDLIERPLEKFRNPFVWALRKMRN